ncbi:MAG: gliding motility-associated C-terminal domain-containing protein, partial [Bacteroidota bacterium]
PVGTFALGTTKEHETSGTFHDPWKGKMDEVRVYNRALTASEVLQLCRMRSKVPVQVLNKYECDRTNSIVRFYDPIPNTEYKLKHLITNSDFGTLTAANSDTFAIHFSTDSAMRYMAYADSSGGITNNDTVYRTPLVKTPITADPKIRDTTFCDSLKITTSLLNSMLGSLTSPSAGRKYYINYPASLIEYTASQLLNLPFQRTSFTIDYKQYIDTTISGQRVNCISSVIKQARVFVGRYPSIPVQYSDTTNCRQSTITLSGPTAPIGQTYTYSWSNGANTRTITLNSADTVTLTVRTSLGCLTTSEPIPVYRRFFSTPAQTIWLPLGRNICPGSVGWLRAPSDPDFRYQWYRNNQLLINEFGPDLHTSFAGSYKCKITYAWGCSNFTDSLELFNAGNPVAEAGPAVVATCSGSTVNLGIADTVDNFTYEWTSAQFTGVLGDAPQLALALPNAGNFLIRLKKTNNAGCSATDSVLVTANPVAIVDAGPADSVCIGSAIQLRPGALRVPDYSFVWRSLDGENDLAYSDTSQSPLLQVNFGRTVNQRLRMEVAWIHNSGVCKGKDTVSLFISPLPSLLIRDQNNNNGWFNICDTRSTTLHLSADLSAPEGAQIISWGIDPSAYDSVILTVADSLTDNPGITFRIRDNARGATSPTVPYWAEVFDSRTGCKSRGTGSWNVIPVPLNTDAGNALRICAGGSAVLRPQTSAGNPHWALPALLPPGITANLVSPNSRECTLTVAAGVSVAQSFLVTYTEDVSNGIFYTCSGSDTVRVYVSPTIQAFPAGLPLMLCSGSGIELPNPAAANYRYQWSKSTGNIMGRLITGQGNTVSYTNFNLLQDSDRLDTLFVSSTDTITGCNRTDTVKVLVLRQVNRYAGVDDSLCDNNPGKFIGITDGPPVFDYSWVALPPANPDSLSYGLNVLGSTDPGAFVHIGPNLSRAVQTARFVRTTGNNTPRGMQPVGGVCKESDTVNLYIFPRPKAVVFGPPVVCPGTDGIIYSATGHEPGNTYQWYLHSSRPSALIMTGITDTAIQVAWGTAEDSAVIKMVARNKYGCYSDTAFYKIKVSTRLEPLVLSSPASVCINDSMADGTGKPGIWYKSKYYATHSRFIWDWDKNAGRLTDTLHGGSWVKIAWKKPGTYSITVTESSRGVLPGATDTCMGTSPPFTITVNPAPSDTVNLHGPNSACLTDSNLIFSSFGSGNLHYKWSVLIPAGNQSPHVIYSSPDSSKVNLRFKDGGLYTVGVQQLNEFGCKGPLKTMQVQVVLAPVAVLAADVKLCPDALNQTYSAFGANGNNFHWTIEGGTFVDSDTNKNSINVLWSRTAEKRMLSVSVSGLFGCESPEVSITPLMDNSALWLSSVGTDEADPNKFRADWKLALSDSNKADVVVIEESPDSTQWKDKISLPLRPTPALSWVVPDSVRGATKNFYRLRMLNQCGRNIYSRVLHNIVLKAEKDANSGLFKPHWTPYYSSPDPINYTLIRKYDNGPYETEPAYFGLSPSDTSFSDPNSQKAFWHTFRIRAHSPGSDSVYSYSNALRIQYSHDLIFYNVISPNGDSLNSSFYIRNLELYPNSQLTLFNRWGKEVYSSDNYLNNWSGADMPSGVYYYMLKENRYNKTYTGWFNITR